jgi:transcriptional regulator with XRE-family HTH domain
MTPDGLKALRARLGLSQAGLAAALDLTEGTIRNYEGARGGVYKIPRVVELACEALVNRPRQSV